MIIDAKDLDFRALNATVRESGETDIRIVNCLGQRFIGAGLKGRSIEIDGIPGNALGCYLSGSSITVNGNAQDQVGDTMDKGTITVHGDVGDCTGYAMRGGSIYVKGSTGYRSGIHMKEYQSNIPVLVIGGSAGSFLGEYQAGGTIIVLGLHTDRPLIGAFCAIGMHGGRIFLRTRDALIPATDKLNVNAASPEDVSSILPYLREYATLFGEDCAMLENSDYVMITPNTKNPYKTLYTYS